MINTPISAVLIDLDDTLYPQSEFLDQAWDAVACHAGTLGLNAHRFRDALARICARGSAQGSIIDLALAEIAADARHSTELIDAFRSFTPGTLTPFEGAVDALGLLAQRHRLALITDGHPAQQRAKLKATGLARYFDAVVCSDDHGRAARKPSPIPFEAALQQLGVEPHETVIVGDNPGKDILGGTRLGMRSVRVRTGEYLSCPDVPGAEPTWTCHNFAAVPALLMQPG